MNQDSPSIGLRAARRPDVEALWALYRAVTSHEDGSRSGRANRLTKTRLSSLVDDGSVLGAWHAEESAGFVAIDLEHGRLHGPVTSSSGSMRETGLRLLVGGERLAATFQRFELTAWEDGASPGLLADQGYRSIDDPDSVNASAPGNERLLFRRFRRRQTHFGRRVEAISRELGIPGNYGSRFRLPLQPEARRLVDVGPDIYDRPQRLTHSAATAWSRMRSAAEADGVRLDLVSAFRSVDYQAGLLRRKLERGLSMGEILEVSAAPGFSEHHSGRALDLTTPGAPVLETGFEDTDAFRWLNSNATGFGFHLSYPRNNRHGVLYEPWHWCFNRERRPG